MDKRCVVVLLLAAGLPFAAGAATHPQKAGKWKTTLQIEMPGMPVSIPPVTTMVCLSEEDVNDPQKSIPRDPKSDCKIANYEVDGNKVTWTMECPKDGMKGRGVITYDGDRYSGQMDISVGDQGMKMKYSGDYLGACDSK